MSLKQVIIVNKAAAISPNALSKCIAKASVSLLTRCFEGAEGFIGRHENKEFHKIVIDWIDNNNQKIDLYEVHGSDLCDCYYWTAEVEGIPGKPIYHDGKLACIAIGPAKEEVFDSFIIGIDEYNN